MTHPDALLQTLNPNAMMAPESGIVELVNYGRGRDGLVPLWTGEGDLPTPAFICDAVNESLARGETFYTWQRGIPELRQALADYHGRLFNRSFAPERFHVVGSGMQAIQIALTMVAGPGGEVVLPTPSWPNLAAAADIGGARHVPVPMRFGNRGWQLDLDAVFDACTPRTRALFINSPSNPTGWTASQDELRAILDFARQRDLWIIADEIYGRFYYSGSLAPSFYDIADEDDRIIFVNSFSKVWAMTGWRVGWLSVPPALGQVVENLIQYSTSGVAAFMQRGAVAALNEGADFATSMIERARAGRDIISAVLEQSPRVRFVRPDGAIYAFFGIDGHADTRALAFRLVDEANVGVSPGSAFGAGASEFMRICFLRDAGQLATAAARLADWIGRLD